MKKLMKKASVFFKNPPPVSNESSELTTEEARDLHKALMQSQAENPTSILDRMKQLHKNSKIWQALSKVAEKKYFAEQLEALNLYFQINPTSDSIKNIDFWKNLLQQLDQLASKERGDKSLYISDNAHKTMEDAVKPDTFNWKTAHDSFREFFDAIVTDTSTRIFSPAFITDIENYSNQGPKV